MNRCLDRIQIWRGDFSYISNYIINFYLTGMFLMFSCWEISYLFLVQLYVLLWFCIPYLMYIDSVWRCSDMFQLQQAFKQTSQEGADNRQALMSAQRKDEASSGMITELTAVSVHIWIIFTHLKLWLASARHNFKWVKILIYIENKMRWSQSCPVCFQFKCW